MLAAGRRLVSSRDFRRVYRRGHKVKGKKLNMYYLPNHSSFTRFGFSISKKTGKAVQRNLLKRRLREICRKHMFDFLNGWDIIFVAREDAAGTLYTCLEKEVLNLGRKGKILTDRTTLAGDGND